ncbi:MAG: hypothetical protein QM296_08830 [Bacillota bacterium]|nr:hypothetical protein [Bacillota bacterium]
MEYSSGSRSMRRPCACHIAAAAPRPPSTTGECEAGQLSHNPRRTRLTKDGRQQAGLHHY